MSHTSTASPLSRLAALFVRARSAPSFDPVAIDRRRIATPGRGPAKTRCIVVRVDDETFERIERGAKASRVKITEAIRQLIKRGLDAASSNQREV